MSKAKGIEALHSSVSQPAQEPSGPARKLARLYGILATVFTVLASVFMVGAIPIVMLGAGLSWFWFRRQQRRMGALVFTIGAGVFYYLMRNILASGAGYEPYTFLALAILVPAACAVGITGYFGHGWKAWVAGVGAWMFSIAILMSPVIAAQQDIVKFLYLMLVTSFMPVLAFAQRFDASRCTDEEHI